MPSDRPDIERYASALVALGRAAEALPQIEAQLGTVLTFLEEQHAIRRFASDPNVNVNGKARALEELLGADIHPVLIHFLQVLLAQHVFHHLNGIAAAFFAQVSARRDEITGELVSAAPLPEAKVAVIETEVGRILGKRVHLRPRVDSSIMGGLRVNVGDFVLDGTLTRQLETMRQTLLRTDFSTLENIQKNP